METGKQFVQWLRPAGCAAVLILTVLATVLLFTAKGTPVKGYEPAESAEYYAQDPEALLAEIETQLLPKIDGAEGVELTLSDGVIRVAGPEGLLHTVRLALIHYFDEDLFEFTEVPE